MKSAFFSNTIIAYPIKTIVSVVYIFSIKLRTAILIGSGTSRIFTYFATVSALRFIFRATALYVPSSLYKRFISTTSFGVMRVPFAIGQSSLLFLRTGFWAVLSWVSLFSIAYFQHSSR